MVEWSNFRAIFSYYLCRVMNNIAIPKSHRWKDIYHLYCIRLFLLNRIMFFQRRRCSVKRYFPCFMTAFRRFHFNFIPFITNFHFVFLCRRLARQAYPFHYNYNRGFPCGRCRRRGPEEEKTSEAAADAFHKPTATGIRSNVCQEQVSGHVHEGRDRHVDKSHRSQGQGEWTLMLLLRR